MQTVTVALPGLAAYTMPIPPPDRLPRIDAIYVSHGAPEWIIGVMIGTPAAEPVRPEIPAGAVLHSELHVPAKPSMGRLERWESRCERGTTSNDGD